MTTLIIAAAWIGIGLLANGFYLDYFRRAYPDSKATGDRVFCLTMAIFGIAAWAGLLVVSRRQHVFRGWRLW